MKRIIALLVVLALVSLCGCGKSTAKDKSKSVNLEDQYYSYAEECIEKKDYKNAISSLEEGIEKTGSQKLKDLLEKVKEMSKVTVEDAISFEQPVAVDPTLNLNPAEILNESSRINKYKAPKITLDSKNANLFNGKLFGQNNWYYEAMKGERSHYCINCSYEYKIYNDDLISIILFASSGRQMAGYSTEYSGFYYSVSEDRELTFEEYLTKINVSTDRLNTLAQSSEDYQNAYGIEFNSKITAAMLDETSSFIIYDGTSSMDGWTPVEFGSALEKQ